MIEVDRELKEESCNSCVDREALTHKVTIGKGKNFSTVITLCPRCLEKLYDEIAEALNK